MQYYLNPRQLLFTFKDIEHSVYCRPQVRLSTLPTEPVIPSKKPFKVELVGGKRYSWCTCGHSKKQVKAPMTSSCVVLYILYILWSHLILSAFLRWSSQVQSPGSVPATLCPRERLHSLVVWLQVHKQPALLWWHAQAGLHRVCPTTWTHWLLNKEWFQFDWETNRQTSAVIREIKLALWL